MEIDDFRFMSTFNQWVNGRLYAVIAQLTEEQYKREMGAFFGSIHQTLNHLLVVDRIWTSRFTGESYDDVQTVHDIVGQDFAAVLSARDVMDLRIITTVSNLDETALNRRYAFHVKVSGQDIEMVGRYMLLAMFNHQTHHRGQVHCMLTQLGFSIPGLDVPGFASRPVAA